MPDETPPQDDRSTVDITIDPSTMIEVRDAFRLQLIKHYHHLLISARTDRKVGKLEAALRQEEEARRTAVMIWSLDNPMKSLTLLKRNKKTPPKPRPGGAEGS